ncbi:MAG: AzlD domain-containing protein [Hyphomicrobiales bacterium]|nr:AzlD domain-containing protein [Hyphomicrobiales bacterium]MDE2114893.1 AzlD domain-containing protein [Hyphomicrobiales bacterium]
MNSTWFDIGSSPYFLLVLFGFLPTIGWKVLSAFVAHAVDDQSEFFKLVRAIATALLAGIAAKFLLAPSGALLNAPLAARLSAIVIAVAAYAIGKRSVMAGVIVGEIAIVILTMLFGH